MLDIYVDVHTYLMSMGQGRVLDEIISPDTWPVVHRVPFFVKHSVPLGDHSADPMALSLAPSSHSLSLARVWIHAYLSE